jgi:short-subunit dehydrogenase
LRAGYSGRKDHELAFSVTNTTSKTAFITGASSGLGAEFAVQLASRGYNLMITSRREELMQQLAQSLISKYGVQVSIFPADLSRVEFIEQLEPVLRNLPALDLLVNSAGFGTVGRFVHVDQAKELAMMNVHMIAPVMFCRAVLPGMLARRQGAIINVSSLSGLIPIRNALYQSTKSFVVDFSSALYTELKDTQVKIQALCPGFVYTQFHDTPEYTHFSRKSIPGFLWMRPEQVVSASLKSLERNQLICIPGLINQVAAFLARNTLSASLIRPVIRFFLRRRTSKNN